MATPPPPASIVEVEDDVPPLMPQDEDDDSNDETEEDENDVEEHQEELPQPMHHSTRIALPERYVLATKIEETVKQLDKKTLEEAKWKATQAEILQIFVELKALTPVMHEVIPGDVEILWSFIF